MLPAQHARSCWHRTHRIEIFAQGFQAAQRRRLPCAVAVHRQNDVLGQFVEHGGVNIGQRRSHWRDHVFEAMLMCHHYVNIALNHNDAIAGTDRLTRLMESIQNATFIEYQRLRRVHVFRVSIAQNPPTKADNPPFGILNWKHQASTKAIIKAASFALQSQSSVAEFLRRGIHAIIQIAQQARPFIRRVAKLKCFNHGAADPALFDVFAHRCGFGRLQQHTRPPARCGLVNIVDPRTLRVFLFVALGAGLKLNARPLRQLLQCFRKRQAFALHQEVENRAAGFAAKAMVAVAVGKNREGGCARVGMERTKAQPVTPGFA